MTSMGRSGDSGSWWSDEGPDGFDDALPAQDQKHGLMDRARRIPPGRHSRSSEGWVDGLRAGDVSRLLKLF